VIKTVEEDESEKIEDKKDVTPVVYNNPIGLTYRQGLTYPYHGVPLVNTVASPTLGFRHHFITKREADAEPKADADADPYLLYGYGSHPYTYTRPYTYSHPYTYNPYLAHTVIKTVEEDESEKIEDKKDVTPVVYNNPIGLTYRQGLTYPYHGVPLVNTVASPTLGFRHHFITKREADAGTFP